MQVWKMNGVDLEAHEAHHATRNMSKHRRVATRTGVLLSHNLPTRSNICFVDAGQNGAVPHFQDPRHGASFRLRSCGYMH
jgi:hypothetical protein